MNYTIETECLKLLSFIKVASWYYISTVYFIIQTSIRENGIIIIAML